MAKHIEQVIREGLKAVFEGHAALAGVVVYEARVRPMGVSDGEQAIEILTGSGTLAPYGSCRAQQDYERELSVQIIGYAAEAGGNTSANVRSSLLFEVESAILTAGVDDPAFSGLVEEILFRRHDFALDPAAYARASFSLTVSVRTTATLSDMQAIA